MVRARFSDLRSLDDRIAPEARAAGVPGPTRSYTLLPQRHETRPEFLRQRHREVIRYLRRVAGTRALWRLRAVREFFEVGARSFDRDLGKKGKEGYVLVSSGGVFGDGKGLLDVGRSAPLFTGFRTRWLMLRESCVCWFEDASFLEPRGLLVVDASFTVRPSPRGNAAEFVIQCVAPVAVAAAAMIA